MSRIAVIADIHANLPALEAVLDDIAALDVDELLVNGDLVGRGPQGSAVIARVRELGLRSTRGNHEDYLLSFRKHEVPEEWLTDPAYSCHRWMADELRASDVEYLDLLPFTLTSEKEPQLRLYHGSPRSHTEGLGVWTEEAVLREHLDSIEESVLVVAHTHRPAQWQFGDETIVNVGSVGLPFNGDTRAQYAVFHGSGSSFEVELRQVDYDRSRILEVYEHSGFLESGDATAALLRREIQTARPHLVPFLRWADAVDRQPLLGAIEDFMAVYDPERSLADFALVLDAIAGRNS